MNKFIRIICACLTVFIYSSLNVFAAETLPSNPWAEDSKEESTYEENISASIKKAVEVFKNLGFTDVDNSTLDDEISYSDYSKLISTVTNGQVQLPDSFKEKITYTDIIKSIVLLTGYDIEAERKGNSTEAYIMTAGENGMLEGFSEDVNENALTGNAILLLYNASKTDMLLEKTEGNTTYQKTEEGYTLLSKYFGIYFDKGQITADNFTSLDSSTGVGDNCIAIDGTEYFTDDMSPDSDVVLGLRGEFYYRQKKSSDDPYLLYFYSNDNLSARAYISPKDVLGYSKSCVLSAYKQNGSGSVKYNISPTANVIRNRTYIGRKAHTLTVDDFTFTTGKIELIDSKNSGTYDVVLISDYEDYIVSYVNSEEYIIYNKFDKAPIDLDGAYLADRVLKNEDNTKTTIDKIKEWNVVEIGRNDYGEITEAVVVNQSVSGKVSNYTGDECTIDGTNYKISDGFFESDYKITAGVEISLIFNINNEIIAIKDFKNSSQYEYGYLINAWVDETENISFKMFTLDGKIQTFNGAEKISVNNSSIKDKNKVIEALKAGTDTVQSDLIMYLLNSTGQIKSIKQAYDEWNTNNPVPYYDNPLRVSAYLAKRIFKSGFLCYKPSEGTFDPSSTTETEAYKEFFVTQNTIFIGVPEVSQQKTNDRGYGIKHYSDFLKDGVYSVKGYNINDNYEMEIVVVEDSLSLISDNDAQLAVVGNIGEALNSDGDIVKQLTLGYDGNISNYCTAQDVNVYEWNYASSADSSATIELSDIHKGDVLRVSINSFGEISTIARLFNISDPPSEFVNSRNMYAEKAYGHVKERLSNIFVLETENAGISTQYIYKPSSETKFYLYNTSRGVLEICSYEDIVDDKTAFEGSRVFLRARDTTVQEVIVFAEN